MSVGEIHAAILAGGLFTFNSPDPKSIVRTALQRHCVDTDAKSYYRTKHFTVTPDNRYALLDAPIVVDRQVFESGASTPGGPPTFVTIPTNEDPLADTTSNDSRHWEIQWKLLDLGAHMGFDVWAPRGDRGRSWQGNRIGDARRMLDRLPLGFDEATMKTVENIDVIWLRRNSIAAAFEVEHTTSIYSGLLRMSDLSSMQPDLTVKFYLVAPDEREAKFAREIARPTFVYGSLVRPLYQSCRFVPYSELTSGLARHKDVLHHLRPGWLDDISIAFDPADDA